MSHSIWNLLVETLSAVHEENIRSTSSANLRNDLVEEINETLKSVCHIGSQPMGSHFYVTTEGYLEPGDLLSSHADSEELELYLPVIFSRNVADSRKSAFAIAHFAQSLDGKIATHNGHSQWIGNEENLIHAHKMRALCDAVVIGANTLNRDKPRLTVRHVSGPDPAKVIIGSGKYDISSLSGGKSPVFQVAPQGCEISKGAVPIEISTESGDMNCHHILDALYLAGIKSLYVEGGSFTTSRFLEQGAIDVLQLHIAPIVLGSGIDAFSLPQKYRIDDSIHFDHHQFFRIGGDMMFQGYLKRRLL